MQSSICKYALCKKNVNKVVLSEELASFRALTTGRHLLKDRLLKKQFYLSSPRVLLAFRKVARPSCPRCPQRRYDLTLDRTKRHLLNTHGLYFCDQCLGTSAALFVGEQPVFTVDGLAEHLKEVHQLKPSPPVPANVLKVSGWTTAERKEERMREERGEGATGPTEGGGRGVAAPEISQWIPS